VVGPARAWVVFRVLGSNVVITRAVRSSACPIRGYRAGKPAGAVHRVLVSMEAAEPKPFDSDLRDYLGKEKSI